MNVRVHDVVAPLPQKPGEAERKAGVQRALDHVAAGGSHAIIKRSIQAAQNEEIRSHAPSGERFGELDGSELGASPHEPAEDVQHSQHSVIHVRSPAAGLRHRRMRDAAQPHIEPEVVQRQGDVGAALDEAAAHSAYAPPSRP